jgi:hypothetical protein
MTIRDGLIVHSRDYNSPVAGARAIGILPQLVSALQEMSAGVNLLAVQALPPAPAGHCARPRRTSRTSQASAW